jgi:ribosomal protein L11 methyltransferase
LLKELLHDLNLPRKQLQAALRELVASGELAYVFEHGRNVLEPSFDQPVRVSERIVLTPPDRAFQPGPADVVIRILRGAAFGAGRHPTTRLALKGIDFILSQRNGSWGRAGSRVLDIGTGSGVLATAAVMLGIETGLALDIDPCAVSEARANVALNGLSERIVVCDRSADDVDDSAYLLVTANLRTPTLVRLAPDIAAYVDPRGALVVSGIRNEECEALLGELGKHYFNAVWRGEEQNWVGLALTKKC